MNPSQSQMATTMDNLYCDLGTSQLVTAWLALSLASFERGCMRDPHLMARTTAESVYHFSTYQRARGN